MIVSETDTTKRALAVEGALSILIGKLAEQETIPAETAISILEMLSSSSDFSRDKHASLIGTLQKLQSLQEKST